MDEPEFRHHGRRVLAPATRDHIHQIVGRIHVGEPDEAVEAFIASRLRPEAPAWLVKAAQREAVKQHHRNLGRYAMVMRGTPFVSRTARRPPHPEP